MSENVTDSYPGEEKNQKHPNYLFVGSSQVVWLKN